jgi:hypothetical protein
MGSKESLQFNKFEVFSNKNNKSVDIRSIPRIEYRESVLSPFVIITAQIVETGNTMSADDGSGSTVSALEGLNLQGTEKVLFEIEDANGNKIKLTDANDLRIATVSRVAQSFKNISYQLNIVSKEAYDNTLLDTRVRTKFDGKISDCVRRILTQFLKTQKDLEVDETTNTYEKWGVDDYPFDKILHLQQIAIPNIKDALGKTSGYLFWETSDGYKFKSLDNLFKIGGKFPNYTDNRGKKIKNYIENKKVDYLSVPQGFDDKILYSKIDRTIDALGQFESGAYGTVLEFFDEVNKTYTKKEPFTPPPDGNGEIAGKELPQFSQEYRGKATVRVVAQRDVGQTFNSGDSPEKQVEKNTLEGISVEDVLQQSQQNFRQKFNMSAEIIIPADFSLHAGDLIYCEFPELSTKSTLTKTPKDSGIYMISDLCHYGDKSQTYTGLRLVRDSFGVKVT